MVRKLLVLAVLAAGCDPIHFARIDVLPSGQQDRFSAEELARCRKLLEEYRGCGCREAEKGRTPQAPYRARAFLDCPWGIDVDAVIEDQQIAVGLCMFPGRLFSPPEEFLQVRDELAKALTAEFGEDRVKVSSRPLEN